MSFPFPKPLIIGMVHFAPLIGRADAPPPAVTLKKARADLRALIRGGIPAVMFENMYDFPHTETVDRKREKQFLSLVKTLSASLKIPFGISLLWNSYGAAFRIAKKTGARWIRVPVFVDSVKTQFGIFTADPKKVLAARQKTDSANIGIFADIQVKHATMLHPRPIEASARAAARAGADAIVITGTWTGEPPTPSDLTRVRRATKTPILIGSGLTSSNIISYLPLTDGMIVGTSLKRGAIAPKTQHRLRTPWQRAVSMVKVKQFLGAINR